MKNSYLFGASRLVFLEKLEGARQEVDYGEEGFGQDKLRKFKYELRSFGCAPGDGCPEYLSSVDGFLEEYRDLLTTNYEAYKDCSYVLMIDKSIEAYKKYLELGYAFLNSGNLEDGRNYFLDVSKYMASKVASEDERVRALFEPFVREKAVGFLEKDPVSLVYSLSGAGYLNNGSLFEFLSKKVKDGYALDDSSFRLVINILAGKAGKDEKFCVLVERLILNSKENTFGDLPRFKSFVYKAAQYSQIAGNDKVLKLVLRRGNHFIVEDRQTRDKVAETLEKRGFKLEDYGFKVD